MRLAVIPARGGSKRIPGKNIRDFHGQPMIAYAIGAARASGLFDQIVVSTDSDAVANVARQYGASVPFSRPAPLADDHTATLPVIQHAIHACAELGWQASELCCIYPCVPLLTAEVVQQSHQLLQQSGADYVFTACHFDFPPLRALTLAADGSVSPSFPQYIGQRSQDLPQLIHDAGQLYWGKASAWLAATPVFGPTSRALLLPRQQVVDIDTEEDWQLALALARPHRR